MPAVVASYQPLKSSIGEKVLLSRSYLRGKFLTSSDLTSKPALTYISCRSSREEEQCDLWLLPWAVRGHHLHHTHQVPDFFRSAFNLVAHIFSIRQTSNPVLLLQPDCPLRAHLLHGSPWIHSSTWLGGETHTRCSYNHLNWTQYQTLLEIMTFTRVCSCAHPSQYICDKTANLDCLGYHPEWPNRSVTFNNTQDNDNCQTLWAVTTVFWIRNETNLAFLVQG